ncbi:hypothetical protein ACHAXS_008556 [Conticribra weissflogii]
MNGSFTDQYWNQYFGIFEFCFQIQTNPNGTVKKYKACTYDHGDKQMEEIDFFVIYATVVLWTTL